MDMNDFIVGVCLVVAVFALIFGGSRWKLIVGMIVGATVTTVATLAESGVGIAGNIGEMISRLGGSL